MRISRRLAQNFAVVCTLLGLSIGALGQKDPGVRGGIQNTGGGLQQQGIPIPHPPLISRNPSTGATVNDHELISFLEGILRAGQLESTCDDCADVTEACSCAESIVARTWPAWTVSPACTFTAVTVPDDVKLRLSVCAAATAPSADTVVLMVPRVTVTSCLVNVIPVAAAEELPLDRIPNHQTPSATTTTIDTHA